MILVIIMTDGRKNCFSKTIRGMVDHLHGYDHILINDDSGNVAYSSWLAQSYGATDVTLFSSNERSGFGGAIRNAWKRAQAFNPKYIFHLEDDFVATKDVWLPDMADVLDNNPYLMQLALRRQPWNDVEKAAGGIVESDPEAYTEKTDGEHTWLEHRKFFTTNPSLYRNELTHRGWPTGSESEGRFGISLFTDQNAKCGFWGSRESGEWVKHIGEERVGTGY